MTAEARTRTATEKHNIVHTVFGFINTVLTLLMIYEVSQRLICLLKLVSQATLYIICSPSYRSSNLRERGHSFHLPDYDTVLFKKSFIVRSLYKFVASNY